MTCTVFYCASLICCTVYCNLLFKYGTIHDHVHVRLRTHTVVDYLSTIRRPLYYCMYVQYLRNKLWLSSALPRVASSGFRLLSAEANKTVSDFVKLRRRMRSSIAPNFASAHHCGIVFAQLLESSLPHTIKCRHHENTFSISHDVGEQDDGCPSFKFQRVMWPRYLSR